jgi:hypothetical protein
LHSESVAAKYQTAAVRVPERKGILADNVAGKFFSIAKIGMQQEVSV